MTRKGTFGVASSIQSIHQKAVISSEVFKIKVNTDLLYPSYFAVYINTATVQYYIKSIATGAIMGHLSQEVLKEIPIVRPPKAVQADIVALMETAYATKRQKEAEAQALLASIDAYVLEKLGITLPTLEKRQCFGVMSSTVEGGRLDGEYYGQSNVDFISSFTSLVFSAVISDITSGTGVYEFTEDHDSSIYYINVNNLDSSLEIDLKSAKKTVAKKMTIAQKGAILTGRVGTIGTFIVNDFQENLAISDNILQIILDESMPINPYYIKFILNSTIIKRQIDRLSKGSLQKVINQQTIKTLQIPLPPKAVQDEIATEVQHRMTTAKRLKVEAQKVLETAKHQVEALLFGA